MKFPQVSDSTLSQFSPSDLNAVSSSVVQEFLSQLLTKVHTTIAIIDFVYSSHYLRMLYQCK